MSIFSPIFFSSSYHAVKLKEGISEIFDNLPIVERAMKECNANGDNIGRQNLSNIFFDMEQTCCRFECMMKGRKVESFMSAFNGNNKRYKFDKQHLFEEIQYIPTNNTEKEGKGKTGMQKIGSTLKKSFNFVKKIKEKITDKPTQKNTGVSNSYNSYHGNQKDKIKEDNYSSYNNIKICYGSPFPCLKKEFNRQILIKAKDIKLILKKNN